MESPVPPITFNSLPPEILHPIILWASEGKPRDLFSLLLVNTRFASVALPLLYSGHVRLNFGKHGSRSFAALAGPGTEEDIGGQGSSKSKSPFFHSYFARIQDLELRIHSHLDGSWDFDCAKRLFARLKALDRLTLVGCSCPDAATTGSEKLLGYLGPRPLSSLKIVSFGSFLPSRIEMDVRDLSLSRTLLGLATSTTDGNTHSSEPEFESGAWSSVRSLTLDEFGLPDGHEPGIDVARCLRRWFPNVVELRLTCSSSNPVDLEDLLPSLPRLEILELRNAWNVVPRFLARLPPRLRTISMHSQPLAEPWLSYLATVREVQLDNCLFQPLDLALLDRSKWRLRNQPNLEYRLERVKVILHDAPVRTRTKRVFEGLQQGISFVLEVECS